MVDEMRGPWRLAYARKRFPAHRARRAQAEPVPGFTQASVARAAEATLIDWATDTDWRFLPVQTDPTAGYLLHPIDLAINKVLALVGRDEPRDYVDALWADAVILPLPALVWAASGKDPGLNPASTLDLLRRRGRPRPEEIARLDLTGPFDIVTAKARWLSALEETAAFIADAPPESAGALFFDSQHQEFCLPRLPLDHTIVVHHGARGGVVPTPASMSLADTPRIRDASAAAPRTPYPARDAQVRRLPREPGRGKGAWQVNADLDEPLPDDVLDAFEGQS